MDAHILERTLMAGRERNRRSGWGVQGNRIEVILRVGEKIAKPNPGDALQVRHATIVASRSQGIELIELPNSVNALRLDGPIRRTGPVGNEELYIFLSPGEIQTHPNTQLGPAGKIGARNGLRYSVIRATQSGCLNVSASLHRIGVILSNGGLDAHVHSRTAPAFARIGGINQVIARGV